jgi:Ca2+-binding RTX toxin-like protein
MANITGTEGADTLQGLNVDPLFTVGNDDIKALGGDDLIIGSTGKDIINAGTGNDTVDFSSVDRGGLFLKSDGSNISNTTAVVGFEPPTIEAIRTSLIDVETIIGNPNLSNTILDISTRGIFGRMDVDLSANRLTFYSAFNNTSKTFTVKNFDNIIAIVGENRLAGNDRDNSIDGGSGTDVILGSKGNDILSGGIFPGGVFGSGANIVDYSNLGRNITFLPKIIVDAFDRPNLAGGTIDKGIFGKDKVRNFQKIVGASDKINTIDASMAESGTTSLDVNLATNSLKIINIPDIGIEQVEVVNFVNVVGGKYNDTIVGGNKNSKLTGGGGNDTITGGTKNDRITGTDITARGVGEVDTLTGGGGRDKFILGNSSGAYYLGNGANDYANITDFNRSKDSIDVGNLKDYSFGFDGANTIDLFSGKDVNTRDLIAKIQLADLNVASLSTSASSSTGTMSVNTSIMGGGASSGIDAIASKIDILSGVNSTADVAI